jgi:hypothetical protein
MVRSQVQQIARALSLVSALVGVMGAGAAYAPGAGTAAAAEPPAAEVAEPTVTGPVTGGRGRALISMPAALRERYGYVEEEFFVEGEATAYRPDGEFGEDGGWSVTEASNAPYETRIIVRRPADPADFDGTVFMEWMNVTGGLDIDVDWSLGHDELMRNGSVYVGVSAQAVGVEGMFPLIPWIGMHLKAWDPARYGTLRHPGDPYSYDIFSQAAQAIRRPTGPDVLGGATARQVIAMGQSQSGARLAAYVNAVQPVAGVFDGFLVHGRGSGAAPLEAGGSPIGDRVVHIRDDLDVPVLQFETETDVVGFHPARQDDTDMIRTWEVAGAPHVDATTMDYFSEVARGILDVDLAALCPRMNRGPQDDVLRGALAALRGWSAGGDPAAEAPRLELDGDAIARDERGIARGGLRTPAVDAPIAVHRGDGACAIFGETQPFTPETLAELYPTHQDYVDAVTESANAAADAGYLVPADAEALITEAETAPVPPVERP